MKYLGDFGDNVLFVKSTPLVVFLCALIFSHLVYAAAPLKPIENANQGIIEIAKENREALKEQRELLEKQADRHLAHVSSMLNVALSVFGSIFLLGAGALTYVLGKSFRELRNNIKTTFETQTKQLIDSEVTELRSMLSSLKQEVVAALQYRFARVVWIQPWELASLAGGDRDRIEKRRDSEQKIMEALAATGVTKIEQVTPVAGSTLEIGSTVLVIFSFESTEDCRRVLSSTITAIKNMSPPPIVLLYTYDPSGNQNSLRPEDWEILKGYDWFVPVNFVPQLITQVLTLLRRAAAPSGVISGNL